MTPVLRRAYRRITNVMGARQRARSGLPGHYLDRARRVVHFCDRYALLRPGSSVLELGTGWLHWESITVRLFHDVEATLFDIWDNRQLASLKRYCDDLAAHIDEEDAWAPDRQEHARRLLAEIAGAPSFDALYRRLGFHYVVDPGGTLSRLPDASFDLVISGSVLQHVRLGILPAYVRDIGRLLRPGGCSIHMIDMGDQLSYYDPTVSIKTYLRYSDRVWRAWFENNIQYFNRVQRPGWLALFDEAGLELLEERPVFSDLGDLRPASVYADLEMRDLTCTILWLVHRKPIPPS